MAETIKISSRWRRLKKMRALLQACWKFTDHPAIKFEDRVAHCVFTFLIVMK